MKKLVLILCILSFAIIMYGGEPLKYSDFKLDDEEYIDDIPFNTYKIVYGSIRTREEIKRMPEQTVPYIISTFGNVYSKDINEINGIRGLNSDHITLYIDGVISYGLNNIPISSIDKCELIGSGVNR
jgi:hypothetical protein